MALNRSIGDIMYWYKPKVFKDYTALDPNGPNKNVAWQGMIYVGMLMQAYVHGNFMCKMLHPSTPQAQSNLSLSHGMTCVCWHELNYNILFMAYNYTLNQLASQTSSCRDHVKPCTNAAQHSSRLDAMRAGPTKFQLENQVDKYLPRATGTLYLFKTLPRQRPPNVAPSVSYGKHLARDLI